MSTEPVKIQTKQVELTGNIAAIAIVERLDLIVGLLERIARPERNGIVTDEQEARWRG